MKYNNSTSSDRFFQIRNARNTEIAEDYTEMIADLINENGEARVVDLAKIFGVTSPTVNSVIRRLVRDGFVVSKPYRAIFLTEKGKTLAKNCKKRHETVYNFLISAGVNPLESCNSSISVGVKSDDDVATPMIFQPILYIYMQKVVNV